SLKENGQEQSVPWRPETIILYPVYPQYYLLSLQNTLLIIIASFVKRGWGFFKNPRPLLVIASYSVIN
ncbi:MAG: hypothetical protein ACI4EY_07415, partial [Lachnospiraceae bacterium]